MKLNYYKDTDSLYIELNSHASADSQEVAAGLVVDFDSLGNVVGLDIQDASKKLDLSTLETNSLPALVTKLIAKADERDLVNPT